MRIALSLLLLVALACLPCLLTGCGSQTSPPADLPPQGGYACHTTLGGTGSGFGQFRGPFGVAADNAGNVYVTDAANQRVVKFTCPPFTATFLAWGTNGTGDGQFLMPTGIAVGSEDNIYVVDYLSHRVQRFDRDDGTYRSTFGGSGSDPGEFQLPYDIAYTTGFFEGSRLWVTDFGGHRVHRNDPSRGWTMWGGLDGGNGQFRRPCGIGCSLEGDVVYVADRDNHRIQKFTENGTYLRQWGGRGDGPGEFEFPEGVAVTPTGEVLVADTQNHRIQRFTATGEFISQFGHHGGFDDPWGLDEPHGIAVNQDGWVFVCDFGNDAIRVYSPES
jgi:tripartite motif-containing protein 71